MKFSSLCSRIAKLEHAFLWLTLTTLLGSIFVPAIAQTPADPISEPLSSPTTPAQADDQAEQRQTIAEQFIDLTFSGQYEAAVQLLHPVLREDWSPSVLQAKTAEFQQRTGSFIQRLDSQIEGDVVLVNTEFEKVTDDVVVIFEAGDQQITGVDFPEDPAPTTP